MSPEGGEYFDGPFADYTPRLAVVPDAQLQYYEAVRFYVNQVVIPAVLAFGAVGNAVVLRRLSAPQRPQRLSRALVMSSAASQRLGLPAGTVAQPGRRRPSERSSLVGLTALSVSDLIFSLITKSRSVGRPCTGTHSRLTYLRGIW